jgi:hypothetical protein
MTSGYHQGREVEWAVVHELTRDGYHTVRAASSKGMADVVAVKDGQVAFISCKRTKSPGPAERAELIRVAAMLPGVGVPIVALGPASRVTYRRLTGHGPHDWVRWVPDQVAS